MKIVAPAARKFFLPVQSARVQAATHYLHGLQLIEQLELPDLPQPAGMLHGRQFSNDSC